MSERRRGLGRGLGALIPSAPAAPKGDRPVDVFFADRATERPPEASDAADGSPDDAGVSAVTPVRDAVEPGTPSDEPKVSRETTDPSGPELVPVPGAHFAELAIGSIEPNPRQPRQVFDEDDMAELVHSIQQVGVLQPVVVRPAPGQAGRYELIMGERRLRAATKAGLAAIPAIVRDTAENDLLRDALLENLHRSQLNALEEAAAYAQLLEDFGCTHEELADRIGRSRPQISNTLRLLKLPPLVQRRVAAGVLTAGHARALLGLTDAAAIERLAQRIVAEGMSVRSVEETVALGGDDEPVRRRRPRAGTRHPQLDELAAALSDRFDTRVKIALGQRRGKLTVEFASVEDLNRIVALLTPGEDEIGPVNAVGS